MVAAALLAWLAAAPGPAPAAIGEPPSASGPRTSAAEQGRLRIESAIELRRDLALRSDRRFVAQLETTPGAGRRTASLGIALTGAEARALKRRERAVASVQSTVTRYVRRPGARAAFAGLYIDQDAGGVVRAGFTRGAERRESDLRGLSSHPGRVATFEASHTQGALERSGREIGRPTSTPPAASPGD